MIQPVKEKIILGIDPGTTIMGYGVLRVRGTKPEMIAMGIIDLRKFANHYLKLRHIHERVLSIIESYLPDELAIEAPFFGKNVQSMLKLGRAQGVAMAVALSRDIPITEYAPLKIKMAITGNGQASKEQVADMLQGCYGSQKMICLLLWMQQMVWQRLIVISCKWGDRQWKKGIVVGRIL